MYIPIPNYCGYPIWGVTDIMEDLHGFTTLNMGVETHDIEILH